MSHDLYNSLCQEMLFDLCYRLGLAEEQFCLLSDTLLAAMSIGELEDKQKAIELMAAYSQSLQIIYADFLLLIEGQSLLFPPVPALWQWNEPRAEEIFSATAEKLYRIAEAMECKLRIKLAEKELHT